MSLSQDILLKELQGLQPVFDEKYGIELIGFLGSWGRNEATGKSDIDIAYRLIKDRKVNLIHLGGAWSELHELFGKDIDLVDWDAVKPSYKAFMESDLVRFYG